MLIVGELGLVLDPDDSWRRVGLDVALEVHVVLKGLAESRPSHGNHRRELDLDGDVAARSFSDAVLSHAVIGAAVLFADLGDLQDVSPEKSINVNSNFPKIPKEINKNG